MSKRIIFSGPECSGKTTLSKAIADKFDLLWAEEVARDFLSNFQGPYEIKDLLEIARLQKQSWLKLPQNEWIICDTGMFVLKIWAEEKFGLTPPLIQSEIDKKDFAFYFLCKPDIPFEADPLRENAEDRDRLFNIYCQTFIDHNLPFQVLSGSLEDRIQQASSTLQTFLAKA